MGRLVDDRRLLLHAAGGGAPALSVREEIRHERGVLAVSSPVDGVEVFVNVVSARRAGYQPWQREVAVAPNERVEIVVELAR